MLEQQKSEKGQALILIVIGFIILLGFVGLAIDGGRVYSDRRHAQNSADAASLAGGAAAALSLENSHLVYKLFDCLNGDTRLYEAKEAARQAAANRAASNGFTIDPNAVNFNYVQVTCNSTCPTCGGFATKYLDITVNISTTTPTTFASFLFKAGLPSQVSAVTRVYPRMPLTYGHAVVALNKSDCQGQQNGVYSHGTADISVIGGGIFTNGCLQGAGNVEVDVNSGTIAYNIAGKGVDKYIGEKINVKDTYMPMDSFEVPRPNCDGRWFNDFPNKAEPGLYCFQNAPDFKKDITGYGVTIYIENGGFNFNGNNKIDLTAPSDIPDPTPAIPGILFYLPASNTSAITINGTSNVHFTGVILAPGASIAFLGTEETTAYETQIIGYNVEMGGTADAEIVFQDNKVYNKPTSLNLQK
jgi:Flp pilus assembly protein TadG